MRPSTVIYGANAVGWTDNACACAAHCPLHLHPIDHSAWHDHDRWVSQLFCSDLIWCRLFSTLMQDEHYKQYVETVSFCAEPRPSLAQLLGPM